jgi:hypothetical protein
VATKRKKLNKPERKTLARLWASGEITVAIVEAFNTLADNGVDQVALLRLIKKRKKTEGGAPTKAEEIARLNYSVSLYQQEHSGTKLREAIRKVLEKDGVLAFFPPFVYDEKGVAVPQIPPSDYMRYSAEEQKKVVHRLATALTRFRKAQKAQGSVNEGVIKIFCGKK